MREGNALRTHGYTYYDGDDGGGGGEARHATTETARGVHACTAQAKQSKAKHNSDSRVPVQTNSGAGGDEKEGAAGHDVRARRVY